MHADHHPLTPQLHHHLTPPMQAVHQHRHLPIKPLIQAPTPSRSLSMPALTPSPSTITLFSLLSPSSDTHLRAVAPSLAVFTYAIPSRPSLHNVLHYWSKKLRQLYPDFDGPVLLLGLQRDLRTDKLVPSPDSSDRSTSGGNEGVRHGPSAVPLNTGQYESVMPQEGLDAARLLHADRYAECSAVTGELMGEVLEDLTRMAAETTVDGGRREQGWGCCVI